MGTSDKYEEVQMSPTTPRPLEGRRAYESIQRKLFSVRSCTFNAGGLGCCLGTSRRLREIK